MAIKAQERVRIAWSHSSPVGRKKSPVSVSMEHPAAVHRGSWGLRCRRLKSTTAI